MDMIKRRGDRVSKIILGVFALTTIMVTIWFYVGQDLKEFTPNPNKGKQMEANASVNNQGNAPNFSLPTLDGTKRQLLAGDKPTLINFWASWCGPCKMELPILQKAYEKYGDRVQFQLVNVAVDDDRKQVQRLIQQQRYTLPVLLDETGEASEVYQIMSLPTTYLVDENGKIVKRVHGAMTESQLDKILESMVNR